MVSADGRLGRWISEESLRQLYERKSCADPDIEVTFNAYKRALKDNTLQELGLLIDGKEYTSDQVFFLTYCRVVCGSGKKCNRAVQNMDSFARAFDCERGSAMYPTKTCNFF